MEYAYDDYALSRFAKALNKTADYIALTKRAGYYANVFDVKSGMVRGRHADGSWVLPYYPDKKESFVTEGTPRQYTFYVPQDVSGLSRLMGGTKNWKMSSIAYLLKESTGMVMNLGIKYRLCITTQLRRGKRKQQCVRFKGRI
jgi:putative alpha-1,2-mannosidase